MNTVYSKSPGVKILKPQNKPCSHFITNSCWTVLQLSLEIFINIKHKIRAMVLM